MYVKIAKTKQKEYEWWKMTLITHIGLYKDDDTWIKWLPHDEKIINKIMDTKTEISIPEVQGWLKEHEIEKIMPKDPNLFDDLIKWF